MYTKLQRQNTSAQLSVIYHKPQVTVKNQLLNHRLTEITTVTLNKITEKNIRNIQQHVEINNYLITKGTDW